VDALAVGDYRMLRARRRRLDSAGRVPAPEEPGAVSAEVPDPEPDQILGRRETGEFTYYA
jgi:hypothetical protein